jgi:hypothetical protein
MSAKDEFRDGRREDYFDVFIAGRGVYDTHATRRAAEHDASEARRLAELTGRRMVSVRVHRRAASDRREIIRTLTIWQRIAGGWTEVERV